MNRITRRDLESLARTILEELVAASESNDPRDHDWLRAYIADIYTWSLVVDECFGATQNEPENTNVLDVGTGTGILALLLKQIGFNVYSCDLPGGAVQEGSLATNGILFQPVDILKDALPYEDGFFHVVVFKDVVEHLPSSPRPVLEEVRRVLAPGGKLILITPNLSRLSSRVRLVMGRSIHFSIQSWFASEFPFGGHYREYTLPELGYMLESSSFRVVRARTFQHQDWRTLVRLRAWLRDSSRQPGRSRILTLSLWKAIGGVVSSLRQELMVVAESLNEADGSAE